jgi:hypothetical protein
MISAIGAMQSARGGTPIQTDPRAVSQADRDQRGIGFQLRGRGRPGRV